jgi:hypothetical protein
MRFLKVGKHSIRAWLILIILGSMFGAAVVAYDLSNLFNISLQVNEPITLVNYPSQFSLYPGEVANFNVTVMNHASVNYSTILSFGLNDSAYQASYVSFSDTVYNVSPGQQTLVAWLKVANDAPQANLLVSVDVVRIGNSTVGWWNTDWQYRKSHVINSAPSAGSGYQVEITVINGSGTDSLNTVYVDNKTRADLGDVRFVANDSTTILDYWMERLFDGENATFWVKVSDDLSASSATIWMYYGNTAATSQSNGANTFLVFDDFEGNSIDTSKWTVFGQVGITNQYAFTGSRSMDQGPGASEITLSAAFASGFRVCAEFRDIPSVNGTESVLKVQNSQHLVLAGVDDDFNTPNYIYRFDDATHYTGIQRTDAWHKIEIECTDNFYVIIDGTLLPLQGTSSGAIGPTQQFSLGSSWSDAYAQNTYWDTFYIRKCVRQEPLQGAWGAEQSAS